MESKISNFFNKSKENLKEFDDGIVHLICEPLFDKNIYDQKWFNDVFFDEARYSIAKNGGMIAIIPKLTFDRNPPILLFNSDLSYVNSVTLPMGEELLDFYMTPEETLVCVSNRGSIYLINQRGRIINHSNLSKKQFTNAAFWETGLFVVTSDSEVYIVEDLATLKMEYFSECKYPLSTVIAIPPHVETDIEEKEEINGEEKKIVEIEVEKSFNAALLGSFTDYNDDQNYIVCINKSTGTKCIPIDYKYEKMVLSEDSSLLAVLASDVGADENEHHVLIFTNNFTTIDYDLFVNMVDIKNVFWIGSTIAIIGVKNIGKGTHNEEERTNDKSYKVFIIGASKKSVKWEFGDGCIGVQEIDGIRIMTREGVFMIRPVSDEIHDFIVQGANEAYEDSVSPENVNVGLKLFREVNDKKINAMKDPLAEIGSSIDKALSNCLDVVEFFFDFEMRKILLDTITRTKYAAKNFNNEAFIEAIKTVRVCKVLEESPLRMPITIEQLKKLRTDRLLVRLCNRFKHIYAQRIAEYLNEKTDTISSHWAHCIIMSSAKPEDVISMINNNGSNIDFIELAQICYSMYDKEVSKLTIPKDPSKMDSYTANKLKQAESKKHLAELLLAQNPVKSRCVPLYIQNGNFDKAVSAAVESNDEELLIYVLNQAKQKNKEDVIQKALSEHPEALAAWIMINQDVDVKLYINAHRTKEAVCEKFDAARKGSTPISEAMNIAKENKDEFGVLVMNNYELVKEKAESLGVNGTAFDIIDELIKNNKESEARSFAKKLKIDAKDVTWRKVNYFFGNPSSNLANELIQELDQEELAVFIEMLYEKNFKYYARQMSVALHDQDLIERLKMEGII